MRAAVYRHYGPPSVLRVEEVETPTPKEHEVQVRVLAASINSWDFELLRGWPPVVRMWGLTRPRYQRPGADIAGRVLSVGPGVTQFTAGDDVFGDLSGSGWGGYSEVLCVPEGALARKPPGLSFAEAAAAPQAAVMALQALREHHRVRAGDRVLVNGAGGGVGTFAVQMAVRLGAEVTAVDRSEKLEKLRALGAVQTTDYTEGDFTRAGERYDLVIDMVLKRPARACFRVLKPGGRYVVVGGPLPRILGCALASRAAALASRKRIRILMLRQNKDLEEIGALMESGKLRAVIDKEFPLERIMEAFAHFAKGQFTGKVVINMGQGEGLA